MGRGGGVVAAVLLLGRSCLLLQDCHLLLLDGPVHLLVGGHVLLPPLAGGHARLCFSGYLQGAHCHVPGGGGGYLLPLQVGGNMLLVFQGLPVVHLRLQVGPDHLQYGGHVLLLLQPGGHVQLSGYLWEAVVHLQVGGHVLLHLQAGGHVQLPGYLWGAVGHLPGGGYLLLHLLGGCLSSLSSIFFSL